MILLNFPISKVRILDLLRFERVSSLFSASFFFASFLLCFSALLFFSSHPTITPSFHLPFASRIARELQVNRTGGTLSVQFSSVVQNHIWVIVLLFFVLFLFSSCFIFVFLSFIAFFLLNIKWSKHVLSRCAVSGVRTHIVTLHHHTIIPPWHHAILTLDHHTITPS